MNTAALLVTGGICVGIPAALAVYVVAWSRHAVIDTPDHTPEYVAIDAEDHDDEPTDDEQRMLNGIETMLGDLRMQTELDRVDDLDLPIKLKQAIRRRVIAGERLADVYQINRQGEQA